MAAIRVYVTRFEHKNFFLFGENPFAATFGGNQYQRVSAIKGILTLANLGCTTILKTRLKTQAARVRRRDCSLTFMHCGSFKTFSLICLNVIST